jgi:phage-related protein
MTFTWTPDFGAEKEIKLAVRQVTFGDGYEQRISNGINLSTETWSVAFVNRDLTEAEAIETFLAAQQGTYSFDWVAPRSIISKKYVCRSWKRAVTHSGLDAITAQFEEVHEP